MNVNERVRALRTTLGLTQTEFGNQVGLKQNTVGQIENGQRGVTDRSIILFCQTFGVNETWLRTGQGEMLRRDTSTVVEQLSREYNLDSIDRAIIDGYLQLGALQRKVIKDYILSLAPAIAGQNIESYQTPAKGDSSAHILISEEDKRELNKATKALKQNDDSKLLE